MTVSKITNAPTQKELIDKTNEIIDNLGGGGSSTDVQINGTSITSGGTANIITNSAYNASSNKIATMSDLPTIDSALSSTSTNPVQNKEITGALNNKADDSAVVKKDGGSSAQTISLSSGTGTTALGVKSRSTTSSYISFTSSSTWLGSIGVNSSKKPVFYNGTGYTLATLDDIPDISGKQDTLVSGTNIKTINNTSLLGSGNIDIQGGTTDVQINGTSITSGGTANIITNSAYNASSNKIATMSDLPTVTTYAGGTGISIGTGNAINHTNSVTAGTIGTSSATSGSTISVPYATYDAQGHITAKGTHTHTVTGFLTSSSSQVASGRFDGQWVLFSDPISLSTATSATTTDVTSTIKSNMGASGTDSYKYEILIQAYCNYKSATSGLSAITTNQTVLLVIVTSGATSSRFFGIIPVYSDKVLKFQRSAAMDTCTIYFCGYRRIGTNS